MRCARPTVVALVLAILVAMGVQAWAALEWRSNFSGDEAIFGLMARHTLAGRVPLYMYGQHYLGSLDAILGAAWPLSAPKLADLLNEARRHWA